MRSRFQTQLAVSRVQKCVYNIVPLTVRRGGGQKPPGYYVGPEMSARFLAGVYLSVTILVL